MPDAAPLTLPPAPDPCVGSYTLHLICANEPYLVWSADVGGPTTVSAVAPCAGCSGGPNVFSVLEAAVAKGWSMEDVKKLSALLRK